MRDNLTSRAAEMGKVLRKGLLRLQKKYDIVGDVRGRGLLQGIEVVAPPHSPIKGDKLGGKIADKAMELGLSCNITNISGLASVFRIAPPLIVEEGQLNAAIDILDQAFEQVTKDVGLDRQHNGVEGIQN